MTSQFQFLRPLQNRVVDHRGATVLLYFDLLFSDSTVTLVGLLVFELCHLLMIAKVLQIDTRYSSNESIHWNSQLVLTQILITLSFKLIWVEVGHLSNTLQIVSNELHKFKVEIKDAKSLKIWRFMVLNNPVIQWDMTTSRSKFKHANHGGWNICYLLHTSVT